MSEHHTGKRQAAVMIVVRHPNSPDPQILLTQRAQGLSSHAGEVAFPGGMQDGDDADLKATALRETGEEVGLSAADLAVQLQLSRSFTRQGVAVTPFVAHLSGEPELVVNADEIAATFWLPFSFLRADSRVRTDVFLRNSQEFWAPVYRFEGHIIWGFTARLLVEFMNRCAGLNLGRNHSAPEAIYKTE